MTAKSRGCVPQKRGYKSLVRGRVIVSSWETMPFIMNCTDAQSCANGDTFNTPHTESVHQIDYAYSSTQQTSESELGFISAFGKIWPIATADNNMTMHGFRRFKTSHLVNLRLLEDELEKLDRDVYQAGMKLGAPISKIDRLGLGQSERDRDAKTASEVMNRETVMRLRGLVQEYGKSLPQ